MTWTRVSKPTSSYTRVSKSYGITDKLFQDGNNFVFQDGNNYVFDIFPGSELWSRVGKT
jgi:hypothetical protein